MALKFYKYFIITIISKPSKSFVRRVIITTHILLKTWRDVGEGAALSNSPVQFSRSVVSDSTTPGTTACQASQQGRNRAPDPTLLTLWPARATALSGFLSRYIWSNTFSDGTVHTCSQSGLYLLIVQMYYSLEDSWVQRQPFPSTISRTLPQYLSPSVYFHWTSWLFRNSFVFP